MDIFNTIVEEYQKENDNYLKQEDSENKKLILFYAYNRYFNCQPSNINFVADYVLSPLFNHFTLMYAYYLGDIDNTVEFTIALDKDTYIDFAEKVSSGLHNLVTQAAKYVFHENDINDNGQKIFDKLQVNAAASPQYIINILCNTYVSPNLKYKMQEEVSKYKSKNKDFHFQLFYLDDVENESLKNFDTSVNQGELSIFNDSGFCKFGKEDSFISIVSAKSIKSLYIEYESKGLFDGNLRYYVPNAKVDNGIKSTIDEDSDNFYYYNNGISIVCDDYKIIDNKIILDKFSIINGCQTTNIIGRSSINKDFGVICKIIKNKFELLDDKLNFIASVAEASNNQKPIKASDLISNRVEQRKLKSELEKNCIFLKIKRGDTYNKDLFKPWQVIANDELAKLLYASVYQKPGVSINAKSVLFDNNNIYNQIFCEKYNNSFISELVLIHHAYTKWKKNKNDINTDAIDVGLKKYSELFIISTISFILKFFSNSSLRIDLLNLIDKNKVNFDNDYIRCLIDLNDIGQIKILNNNIYEDDINKVFESINFLFSSIFQKFIYPAFKKVSKSTVNNYASFVKNDSIYYDYVIKPLILTFQKDEEKIYNLFHPYLNIDCKVDGTNLKRMNVMVDQGINLKTALEKFKDNEISAYMGSGNIKKKIINDEDIKKIVNNLPKTNADLKKIGFNDAKIEKYGKQIFEYVRTYASSKNL